MADLADMAAEREAIHRAESLARVMRPRPMGAGADCCDACGDPIPLARREAVPGVCFCVACQAERDEDLAQGWRTWI